ncbi:MAG: hypothetical protein AB7S38_27290 [Vulcanimicrobiota bacterium]
MSEIERLARSHPLVACQQPSFDGLYSRYQRLRWQFMNNELRQVLMASWQAGPGSELWFFASGDYRLPGPAPTAARLLPLEASEGATWQDTDRFAREPGATVALQPGRWFWLGPMAHDCWWCLAR